MSETPTGMVDKLVKASMGILIATIALSCAMSVLRSILPILVPVVGVVGLVWVGIVVYKTRKDRF